MDIKTRAIVVVSAAVTLTILALAVEIRFGIFRAMTGGYWPLNIPPDCSPSCATALLIESGAAASAAVMALTGLANVALVSISIMLLWGNLKEARIVSAEAAKSSAAAQAAVDQAKHATESNLAIGRQQVRAYLGTGDCEVRVVDGTLKVTIGVFNSGQTPARQVAIEFVSIVLPRGTSSWTDPGVVGQSFTFGLSDLAAGENRPIERTVITKEEMERSNFNPTPPLAVEIECLLRYRDVFDEWHTERPIAYHRSVNMIGGTPVGLYRKLQPRSSSEREK